MRIMIRTGKALTACAVAISAGGLIVGLPTVSSAAAAVYYVAPGGSDSAAGTLSAPWASFAHAQSVARAGDTVYFRGGTFTYTHADCSCASQMASVNGITGFWR